MAMRSNQSSITAENNALLRAFEFMRPESERICHDPYAANFLPERFLSAKDQYAQMHQTICRWNALFPGVCDAIIARSRFIDDCLTDAIDGGIQQLVILGAGYDTRAFRFDKLKGTMMVFELDHPSTQNAKLERINKYIQTDLSHVRYIAIDFQREPLNVKLFSNGYDSALKTFFIWEGVTYYVPASAVDHTLSFIAGNSASQSSVVFDYFRPSVARNSNRLKEARALREGLKQIGEEILFGIAPEKLPEFMGVHRFKVIKNLTATQYATVSLRVKETKRKFSKMFIFSLATVI
jgi:methyltransferase (TIGR00027 family)